MFCGGDVMLNLPASTIFNRRIPKQKFYTNLPVSSKVVRLFTDQIDSIYWAHKLAPDTINVESGTSVLEIQILQIRLKTESLDESVITLIDREIPYHLVFVVCYQDYAQLWIAYKEEAKNREDKYKVNRYYKTEWMPLEKLSLKLEGINLDQIYESFILQIAGSELEKYEEEDLKDAIDRSEATERLKTAITRLEKQIIREKQYNRQVRLHGELRRLQEELRMLERRRA